MNKIVGIYKLPSVKHVFLIVSDLSIFDDPQESSIENKRRMEYFEHILGYKDYMSPKAIPRWRLKILTQSDFLTVLERQKTREKVLSNQSFHNPEALELLAINLTKTPSNPRSETFCTPKQLGTLLDEDIIEVFI